MNTRIFLTLFISILIVSLVLSILLFDQKFSLGGDDADFIVLAKSLTQGQGMKYINLPNPTINTQYPFGFPLILSFVERISASNYTAMKTMVLIFFISTLPLLYLLVKGYAGKSLALLTMTFTGISPFLLDFSHQVMSEIPYLFFSVLALFLLERSQRYRSTWGNYWFVGATLALVFSYYVRTAGISVIAAGVVFLLIKKDYKKALFLAVAALCLALPWIWRNARLGGNSYIYQLLLVNPYHPDLGKLDIGSLFVRIKVNLGIYILQEIPRIILPTFHHLILSLSIFAITAHGLVVSFFRSRNTFSIYPVFFFGTCLLWPQVWSGMRFVLPAVPFVIVLFWFGLIELLCRLKIRHAVNHVILVVVFVGLAVSNISAISELKEQIRTYPPNWRNYFAAGDWIRNNTPEQSIISCRKECLMYLSSGRKTVGYAWSENTDVVINQMRKDKVDYVVLEQLGFGSTPRYLVPAIKKNLDKFKPLFFADKPATYVLRFVGY